MHISSLRAEMARKYVGSSTNTAAPGLTNSDVTKCKPFVAPDDRMISLLKINENTPYKNRCNYYTWES